MCASRMFHSSGTIQSNTFVPLAISLRVERDVLLEHVERLAHAIAGEAAADREEPAISSRASAPGVLLMSRLGDVQHQASTALRQ